MGGSNDVASKVFFNNEGELRAGWRVLAFVVLLIVSLALVSTFVAGLGAMIPQIGHYFLQPGEAEGLGPRAFASFSISQAVNVTAAIAATAIAARALERRSFASVGFKLHRGWLRDFSIGSILGAASLAIAVVISALAGALTLNAQITSEAIIARNFAFLLIFFLLAATYEELLFRGFAFQAIVRGLGPVAAIAITSLLFGVAHIPNKNASLFSTINTVLAGVWLGVAYIKTRSLWLATALHYSWNFATVFIFGLPVSGFSTFDQLAWLDGDLLAPAWLSGASYGPEGGAAATVAVLISTLIVWKLRLFSPSEDMLAEIEKRDASWLLSGPAKPDSDQQK